MRKHPPVCTSCFTLLPLLPLLLLLLLPLLLLFHSLPAPLSLYTESVIWLTHNLSIFFFFFFFFFFSLCVYTAASRVHFASYTHVSRKKRVNVKEKVCKSHISWKTGAVSLERQLIRVAAVGALHANQLTSLLLWRLFVSSLEKHSHPACEKMRKRKQVQSIAGHSLTRSTCRLLTFYNEKKKKRFLFYFQYFFARASLLFCSHSVLRKNAPLHDRVSLCDGWKSHLSIPLSSLDVAFTSSSSSSSSPLHTSCTGTRSYREKRKKTMQPCPHLFQVLLLLSPLSALCICLYSATLLLAPEMSSRSPSASSYDET